MRDSPSTHGSFSDHPLFEALVLLILEPQYLSVDLFMWSRRLAFFFFHCCTTITKCRQRGLEPNRQGSRRPPTTFTTCATAQNTSKFILPPSSYPPTLGAKHHAAGLVCRKREKKLDDEEAHSHPTLRSKARSVFLRERKATTPRNLSNLSTEKCRLACRRRERG